MGRGIDVGVEGSFFWGRGCLVESEAGQAIRSISGRGERAIISRNPGWIHQIFEEDLSRSVPVCVILVRVCQRNNRVVGFREVEFLVSLVDLLVSFCVVS